MWQASGLDPLGATHPTTWNMFDKSSWTTAESVMSAQVKNATATVHARVSPCPIIFFFFFD